MNKKLLLIIPITTIIIIAGIFLVLQLNNDSDDDDNDDDSNLALPLDLKKGRLLEVDITMAEGMDYPTAFDIAKSMGIDFITLSFGWDDIETEPYNYTNENLEIANWYYPLKNCKIALVIAPIDTNVDRRPTDLKGKAFNDTQVISRCKDMLYNVSTQLSNVDILSLSIGNEIDAYLGLDQKAWANYTDFFNQTSDYARTLWPNAKIGCKTMFEAITKTHKIEASLLNNYNYLLPYL